MSDPAPEPTRVHYVHGLSYTFQERLVGAFVLSALLLGALLFFYSGQASTLFAKKFSVSASLRNAQGLASDAKVFVSGVEVGRVRAIDITENNDIRLTLELLERFHPLVRTDSRASLSKLAMIGNASVEIRAGNPKLAEIPDGASIPVDEPMTVEQLLGEVAPVLNDFKQMVQRLDAIMQAVDPQDVSRGVKSLQVSLANIERITGQLAAGQGALGELAHNPEVQHDLTAVLKNAHGASLDLRRASNDLPDLMVRLRLLVEQMNLTLRAIQGTWPVSSSVPSESAPPLIVTPAPQP
jgi:phospholipid/cholesterol/gamma-HCH transport system substrate-binding protein